MVEWSFVQQALVRFSTALSSNTKIRDQIDHMLQEKSVFEKLRKKLQRVGNVVFAIFNNFVTDISGL